MKLSRIFLLTLLAMPSHSSFAATEFDDGVPAEVINQALKIDPENPKALELAGAAAFEAKDFPLAIKHWQKLLNKTAADSEVGRALIERIEEAKKRLKQ